MGARRSRGAGAQLELGFPNGWGGARKNAGCKPGLRPSTPHRRRPVQRAAEPVHVTLRARIAPLRSQFVFPTVRLALVRAARRDPDRFRIVHFSVQRDHVHLVVEAEDKRSLSSGLRSVAIRVARYVNDLLGRRGPLWAERWHGRALTSPRSVRNAIVYVLANFRKHVSGPLRDGLDPYSSASWFDGFREWRRDSGVPPPLAVPARWRSFAGDTTTLEAGCAEDFAPRTWLAARGWRRHRLVGIAESPVR
jgi:putative transposase